MRLSCICNPPKQRGHRRRRYSLGLESGGVGLAWVGCRRAEGDGEEDEDEWEDDRWVVNNGMAEDVQCEDAVGVTDDGDRSRELPSGGDDGGGGEDNNGEEGGEEPIT